MNYGQEEIPRLNYTYVFDFEDQFSYRDKLQWMEQNWKTSFLYVAIYMAIIFAGRQYMKQRDRFELRGLLFVWNVALATFSIIGTIRTFPELAYVLREFGLHHSACNPSFLVHTKVSGFWAWMFALSKVPELGDTIFIILKKNRLLFLHVYHHVTVLVFVWYTSANNTSSARWFMVMNYAVHSVMYSYYALRALRISVPKPVCMFITVAQLLQMAVGFYINVYVYQSKRLGKACSVTDAQNTVSFLMYGSYFLLFLHFFYGSYMKKRVMPHQSSQCMPTIKSNKVD